MKIGNIALRSDVVLAPLAGYSDVGFRSICVKYGVGLTYTEMVSAKGMCYENKKTYDLLSTAKNENPVAVQIFGSEPEYMYKAAKDERLKKFDIIDINMGCPVPKIVKNGEGSALLNDVERAKDVVRAVKEGSNKPVSVKFRKGFGLSDDTAVKFGLSMQEAGADAVTLHARTREQYYSGSADWDSIKRLKEAVNIPVIANGDVQSKSDYDRIKELTGCDGVMIGRGAIGKPYLFGQIVGMRGKVNLASDVIEHIDCLAEFLPERVVVNDMKKHICYYAKSVSESKKIKALVCEVKTISELKDLVNDKFNVEINLEG